MSRQDLLNISEQDLEGYSNRGTVKRARKDFSKLNDVDNLLSINEQGIQIIWPDNVTTTLSKDHVYPDCLCTCPSTTTCRHMIMLVLVYQASIDATSINTSLEWDPGTISDQVIDTYFSATELKKARHLFDTGILIELTRGDKPTAIIETFGIAVRFLVPDDPRYIQSDCDPNLTKSAALIAIWAFRKLPTAERTGYISTYITPPPSPEAKLAYQKIIEEFSDLLLLGCAQTPPHLKDRLTRSALYYQNTGWVWPAKNLHSIVNQLEWYENRDGLFDPSLIIRNIGEFMCRYQALNAPSIPIPEIIVRGEEHTRNKEKSTKSRFIGLGCKVCETNSGLKIQSFFQSADTGGVAVLEKEIPEKEEQEEKPFSTIAKSHYVNQIPFEQISKGQVLTASAKRSVDNQIFFGRNTTCNPQSYKWENLRAPLIMDNFEDLKNRLALRPPSAFRSLKSSEDFYVLKIHDINQSRFDNTSQLMTARLYDQEEQYIDLAFPYSNRTKNGVESLIALFSAPSIKINYIAGNLIEHTDKLVIEPTSLIYTDNDQRKILQPWIEPDILTFSPGKKITMTKNNDALTKTSVDIIVEELDDILGEIIISGSYHTDEKTAEMWKNITVRAKNIGFHLLFELMQNSAPVIDSQIKFCNIDNLLKIIIYSRLGRTS